MMMFNDKRVSMSMATLVFLFSTITTSNAFVLPDSPKGLFQQRADATTTGFRNQHPTFVRSNSRSGSALPYKIRDDDETKGDSTATRTQQQQRTVSSTSTSTSSTWTSQLSTESDYRTALEELLQSNAQVTEQSSIIFLFVGPYHAPNFTQIAKYATELMQSSYCRIVTVLGGGVLGKGGESEAPDQVVSNYQENTTQKTPQQPSMSMLAAPKASVADVDIFSFHETQNPPPGDFEEYWNEQGVTKPSSSYLLFGDPWSPMDTVVEELQDDNVVIAGGVTVPTRPQPTIAIDNESLPQGSMVGIGLQDVQMQVLVSQACRAIGPTVNVTDCVHKNTVTELNHEPAFDTLQRVQESLSKDDKQLLANTNPRQSLGVMCGVQSQSSHSDTTTDTDTDDNPFLVREIIGFEPQRNGIVLGTNELQAGDQLQFYIRDEQAAQDQLKLQIQRAQTERMLSSTDSTSPLAALQISSIARARCGNQSNTNNDMDQISKLLLSTSDSASTPAIAGFFGNGQLGPASGLAGFVSSAKTTTVLHGFATVAILMSQKNENRIEHNDATSTTTSTSYDAMLNAWE